MIRPLFICLLAICLSRAAPVDSRAASPSDQDSLGRVLEGLAPGPRIAYLNYLLESGRTDPEIYFQLGVAYYEGENSDSALHCYAKAVALSPSLSKAYVNMGVIFDGQNRRGEALRMFEKAVEANPKDLLAHAHAAYALFDSGEYEAAETHLSKAFAIDSLDPQPHFYLAIFFWESGMFRESLVEWEKVVSCAPGSDLAEKARENITILQHALLAPPGEGIPPPRP
ncbi:MAG: tetratricopeptide repeat protein [Candidatus Krumholzibacteria bacterium]|nr:tetratricopeptide repeat protein [Candidatus Krumholzibacteria bacterium]